MNSSLEELVFNDKEKASHVNVRYFELYLANLNDEHFNQVIYPMIVFSMKRSAESTIGNVICVIEGLKFTFTEQVVRNLVSEILTTHLLVHEEHSKTSADLIKEVCKHAKVAPED